MEGFLSVNGLILRNLQACVERVSHILFLLAVKDDRIEMPRTLHRERQRLLSKNGIPGMVR